MGEADPFPVTVNVELQIMETIPPPDTVVPPVVSSATVPAGELLSEEEAYFERLLEEQRAAVRHYRVRVRVFLIAGGAIVIASGIWIGLYRSSASTIASVIASYVTFGGGLILASASSFPYKETLNRLNKVITYENLLRIICKIREEGGKNSEDLERLKGKYSLVMELMLKEC